MSVPNDTVVAFTVEITNNNLQEVADWIGSWWVGGEDIEVGQTVVKVGDTFKLFQEVSDGYRW